MKKFFKTKPFLGLLLALSLVATSLAPLSTVDAVETTETGKKYAFEKVDNDVIKSTAKNTDVFNVEASEMQFADDEQVRVSIVLDGTSVVDAGYSTEDLPENAAALDLIEEVLDEQKVMEEKIADEVNIDVKWNLTVAANIISADVAYGDIEAIENIDGVKEVIVETKYLPCSPVDAADPEMVISQTDMTGVSEAWAKGQTGAGGRIAIIDTGLDITHQSFNNDAFLYALQEDARWNLYKNFNAYLNKIDLLDAKDIEKVLPLLNSYATLNGNVSAEDFVISDKIAYAFNYVDEDFNVEHIYDGQGEHGSHVAGIATANRYLKTEDGFADALETVYVAGNAPDAQILVMKVFGVGGGAYDSDYMAAIEDAILLGCDSVNLSLGSAAPGFTVSTDYQEIMNKLTASDTVVVISAGNAGAWADQAVAGELFYDGVSYMTAGSPGTFTNALTVASVDNNGAIGKVIEVAGNTVPYSESTTYGNKPLDTLAGDADSAEVEYVFINGFGQATDYEGIDVAGKVVFCSRGTTSFFEKANIAASLGAAATIIYNNTTGTIGLNLTGYEYSAPCVSIKLDDAAVIREASEAQTTADGVTYYTGKVTIKKGLTPVIYNADHYQMSSFSSWGVPGNLSIKPEITAPGGGIYSVFGSCDIGGGPDQYELMSGTSMAAPQVTGMMAVLKRYVETSWYKKFPNVSHRAIAQSLLMSTATPMVDADGNVYPVMQQGAGLANVNNAINAASFVMMDENSTVSAKDGKIKAELGDDPAKKGEYKVSFTLTNLTPTSHTYKLDDYVFTQALSGAFLTKGTEKLDADVTYYVDGKKVTGVAEEINPYTAQVEAAEAELKASMDKYNDAMGVAEKAGREVVAAIAKRTGAVAGVAEAKAVLAAAKIKESIAKTQRKFVKNGEKLYQEAVKERQAAEAKVKAANEALDSASKAVTKAEKAAVTANKAVADALAKNVAAQAKVVDLNTKKAAWKPSVVENTVVLGKNKTAKVDVVIKLTDATKAYLDENYEVGAYVEAYIFCNAQDNTSSHSIPVLAYYGNWTDPSMFDKGTALEYFHGVEDIPPYLYDVNNIDSNYFVAYDAESNTKNPLGFTGYGMNQPELYKPYYFSMNNENGSYIDSVKYSLIRSAAKRAIVISDYNTGEIYAAGELGSQISAYYYANQARWYNTSSSIGIGWKGTDANGNALPEGTQVVLSLVAAPEYNVKEDGSIDFASLGEGAFLSSLLTIDNTAPELDAFGGSEIGRPGTEEGKDNLYILVEDNVAVAAVELYDGDGNALGALPLAKDFGYVTVPDVDADVYFVKAYDYAGNASTYRVFVLVEPTTEVESIEISDEQLLLTKNSVYKLTAKVGPNTLIDDTVTWTSSDEEVAVVSENGLVTAVGVGECVITATANADEEFKAECSVEVFSIERELEAFVWDEEGQVWLAALNTAEAPIYYPISDVPGNLPINATAWKTDESAVYTTTIDTQKQLSSLYEMDPDTLEFTKVGDSSIMYSDIAEAPHLTGLIGLYMNYVVLIDPTTGDYLGAFNYAPSGRNLVGITYGGSVLNSYYNKYLDMYYILDDAGDIYFEAFMPYQGSYVYFNGADEALVKSTGVKCDMPYFQSLYFDGEFTYISNFNSSKNVVDLYAVDTEDTGAVYKLGTFADGVWPVAGLCNIYDFSDIILSHAEGLADKEFKAEASTEAVEKIDFTPVNK